MSIITLFIILQIINQIHSYIIEKSLIKPSLNNNIFQIPFTYIFNSNIETEKIISENTFNFILTKEDYFRLENFSIGKFLLSKYKCSLQIYNNYQNTEIKLESIPNSQYPIFSCNLNYFSLENLIDKSYSLYKTVNMILFIELSLLNNYFSSCFELDSFLLTTSNNQQSISNLIKFQNLFTTEFCNKSYPFTLYNSTLFENTSFNVNNTITLWEDFSLLLKFNNFQFETPILDFSYVNIRIELDNLYYLRMNYTINLVHISNDNILTNISFPLAQNQSNLNISHILIKDNPGSDKSIIHLRNLNFSLTKGESLEIIINNVIIKKQRTSLPNIITKFTHDSSYSLLETIDLNEEILKTNITIKSLKTNENNRVILKGNNFNMLFSNSAWEMYFRLDLDELKVLVDRAFLINKGENKFYLKVTLYNNVLNGLELEFSKGLCKVNKKNNKCLNNIKSATIQENVENGFFVDITDNILNKDYIYDISFWVFPIVCSKEINEFRNISKIPKQYIDYSIEILILSQDSISEFAYIENENKSKILNSNIQCIDTIVTHENSPNKISLWYNNTSLINNISDIMLFKELSSFKIRSKLYRQNNNITYTTLRFELRQEDIIGLSLPLPIIINNNLYKRVEGRLSFSINLNNNLIINKPFTSNCKIKWLTNTQPENDDFYDNSNKNILSSYSSIVNSINFPNPFFIINANTIASLTFELNCMEYNLDYIKNSKVDDYISISYLFERKLPEGYFPTRAFRLISFIQQIENPINSRVVFTKEVNSSDLNVTLIGDDFQEVNLERNDFYLNLINKIDSQTNKICIIDFSYDKVGLNKLYDRFYYRDMSLYLFLLGIDFLNEDDNLYENNNNDIYIDRKYSSYMSLRYKNLLYDINLYGDYLNNKNNNKLSPLNQLFFKTSSNISYIDYILNINKTSYSDNQSYMIYFLSSIILIKPTSQLSKRTILPFICPTKLKNDIGYASDINNYFKFTFNYGKIPFRNITKSVNSILFKKNPKLSETNVEDLDLSSSPQTNLNETNNQIILNYYDINTFNSTIIVNSKYLHSSNYQSSVIYIKSIIFDLSSFIFYSTNNSSSNLSINSFNLTLKLYSEADGFTTISNNSYSSTYLLYNKIKHLFIFSLNNLKLSNNSIITLQIEGINTDISYISSNSTSIENGVRIRYITSISNLLYADNEFTSLLKNELPKTNFQLTPIISGLSTLSYIIKIYKNTFIDYSNKIIMNFKSLLIGLNKEIRCFLLINTKNIRCDFSSNKIICRIKKNIKDIIDSNNNSTYVFYLNCYNIDFLKSSDEILLYNNYDYFNEASGFYIEYLNNNKNRIENLQVGNIEDKDMIKLNVNKSNIDQSLNQFNNLNDDILKIEYLNTNKYNEISSIKIIIKYPIHLIYENIKIDINLNSDKGVFNNTKCNQRRPYIDLECKVTSPTSFSIYFSDKIYDYLSKINLNSQISMKYIELEYILSPLKSNLLTSALIISYLDDVVIIKKQSNLLNTIKEDLSYTSMNQLSNGMIFISNLKFNENIDTFDYIDIDISIMINDDTYLDYINSSSIINIFMNYNIIIIENDELTCFDPINNSSFICSFYEEKSLLSIYIFKEDLINIGNEGVAIRIKNIKMKDFNNLDDTFTYSVIYEDDNSIYINSIIGVSNYIGETVMSSLFLIPERSYFNVDDLKSIDTFFVPSYSKSISYSDTNLLLNLISNNTCIYFRFTYENENNYTFFNNSILYNSPDIAYIEVELYNSTYNNTYLPYVYNTSNVKYEWNDILTSCFENENGGIFKFRPEALKVKLSFISYFNFNQTFSSIEVGLINVNNNFTLLSKSISSSKLSYKSNDLLNIILSDKSSNNSSELYKNILSEMFTSPFFFRSASISSGGASNEKQQRHTIKTNISQKSFKKGVFTNVDFFIVNSQLKDDSNIYSTNLLIQSKLFKINPFSLSLNTFNQFYYNASLGVPCGIQTGKYFLKFIISNKIQFFNPQPELVFVEETKLNIKLQFSLSSDYNFILADNTFKSYFSSMVIIFPFTKEILFEKTTFEISISNESLKYSNFSSFNLNKFDLPFNETLFDGIKYTNTFNSSLLKEFPFITYEFKNKNNKCMSPITYLKIDFINFNSKPNLTQIKETSGLSTSNISDFINILPENFLQNTLLSFNLQIKNSIYFSSFSCFLTTFSDYLSEKQVFPSKGANINEIINFIEQNQISKSSYFIVQNNHPIFKSYNLTMKFDYLYRGEEHIIKCFLCDNSIVSNSSFIKSKPATKTFIINRLFSTSLPSPEAIKIYYNTEYLSKNNLNKSELINELLFNSQKELYKYLKSLPNCDCSNIVISNENDEVISNIPINNVDFSLKTYLKSDSYTLNLENSKYESVLYFHSEFDLKKNYPKKETLLHISNYLIDKYGSSIISKLIISTEYNFYFDYTSFLKRQLDYDKSLFIESILYKVIYKVMNIRGKFNNNENFYCMYMMNNYTEGSNNTKRNFGEINNCLSNQLGREDDTIRQIYNDTDMINYCGEIMFYQALREYSIYFDPRSRGVYSMDAYCRNINRYNAYNNTNTYSNIDQYVYVNLGGVIVNDVYQKEAKLRSFTENVKISNLIYMIIGLMLLTI